MCNCIITCICASLDTQPKTENPTGIIQGVACLLGKTRPPFVGIIREDANIFDIKNHFKSYAYTLSPKLVGIMNNKNKEQQYKTLKRLHDECLSQFKCSYIINIEEYPSDTNYLHCHGLIRFVNHAQKEKFKKLIKDKITMGKKGTYNKLVDCEFVNNFQIWADYIYKDQAHIVSLGYSAFIHIDYSFHISDETAPPKVNVAPAFKTRCKPSDRTKTEIKIMKLENELKKLKKSLEISNINCV